MCCNNYFINDYMFANSALIMITGFEHLAKAGLQTSPAKGRPKVSVFKFEFDKYGLGYILTLV